MGRENPALPADEIWDKAKAARERAQEAHRRTAEVFEKAAEGHRQAASLQATHARHAREDGDGETARRAERQASAERVLEERSAEGAARHRKKLWESEERER